MPPVFATQMFRPCIDLHEGKVKQIVGGTLSGDPHTLRTNFVSDKPAEWYAALYKKDKLVGGHIVMLGPGNEAPARAALAAYPGGMQIGGGIRPDNASSWLNAGASHVIVTSWLFRDGFFDDARLQEMVRTVGPDRLVLDLSCRFKDGLYHVVTDRFQRFTNLVVGRDTLGRLAGSCAEFLVHAVDAEGLVRGIDERLITLLAEASPIPLTYAGGARSLADLETVARLGHGRVHLTIGSALDIFGGTGVRYADCVEFNRRMMAVSAGASTDR